MATPVPVARRAMAPATKGWKRSTLSKARTWLWRAAAKRSCSLAGAPWRGGADGSMRARIARARGDFPVAIGPVGARRGYGPVGGSGGKERTSGQVRGGRWGRGVGGGGGGGGGGVWGGGGGGGGGGAERKGQGWGGGSLGVRESRSLGDGGAGCSQESMRCWEVGVISRSSLFSLARWRR